MGIACAILLHMQFYNKSLEKHALIHSSMNKARCWMEFMSIQNKLKAVEKVVEESEALGFVKKYNEKSE